MEEKYRKILTWNKKDPNYPARDYELSYDDKYGIYEKLLEIPFYQRIPYTIPFIGCNYKKKEGILLVCSHFSMPDYEIPKHQINTDINEWYRLVFEGPELDKKASYLFENQLKNKDGTCCHTGDWINVRCHMNDSNSGWPWYKLADAIIDNNVWGGNFINEQQGQRENVFQYLSLMNYYVRPGTGGILERKRKRDKEESIRVFKEVVSALKPKLIFFAHRGAYNDFTHSHGRYIEEFIDPNIQVFASDYPYKIPGRYAHWKISEKGGQYFTNTMGKYKPAGL